MKRRNKLSYLEWCNLTGREYGIKIYNRSPINEGFCSCNIELLESPEDAGYNCVEIDYVWQNGLSREENIMIFFNRVERMYCECLQKT